VFKKQPVVAMQTARSRSGQKHPDAVVCGNSIGPVATSLAVSPAQYVLALSRHATSVGGHMEDAAKSARDMLIPGTPESFWTSLEAPVWSPPALPLVIVAPHPVDETLGVGGLIHTWATVHGLPVTIVSVTDGEAARPDVAGLATVRRRELEAARQELAPEGIDIVSLGLPDGRVCEHTNELRAAIEQVLAGEATIVAPFEQDGQPDYNATSEAAREVSQRHGMLLAQYPIWAWYQMTPVIFNERRLGRFMLSPAARRAKQNAIHRFESQLRDRPDGAIVPAHVLEYFARPYEMFVL
jgi:LmbE family N-acetylglucosaminyl deacetylase